MEVTTVVRRESPRIVRMSVRGELDATNADLLRAAFEAAIADGHARLEADLADVTFCSLAGLTVLLGARRALGDRLVVLAAPPGVRRLLSVLHMPGALGDAQ
ncbi:STAS domain-containing protein [Dactylosporangium vinaceum]|uniref:STAS domain-containing protein n=1 Tax=Dactylosporangium vinaceum TaxID=53362 RepID=A0ABV5MA95_9ACTN|nr:STAS domain-containing protein [Dactylosporangium vinaceum]UAB93043.1 STAS domain-containing protein [Dactylosporangium vinaceum]